MARTSKPFRMPPDLHKRAVALNEKVVERWPPPENYRKGGPAAAVHVGVTLLEAVLNGEQHIVPDADMQKYEAAYRGREKAALLSIVALAIAMGWARDQGADDVDARASDIVARVLRQLVQSEILKAEHEAAPQMGESLRQIAREFLDDAERLSARARAAIGMESAR